MHRISQTLVELPFILVFTEFFQTTQQFVAKKYKKFLDNIIMKSFEKMAKDKEMNYMICENWLKRIL